MRMKYECMIFERKINACAKRMFLLFAADVSIKSNGVAALAADEA